MKIVLVMPVFDPAISFGGPVVQAWQVARLLAERGHLVSVITSDLEIPENDPRNQWVERKGVRIWYGSTSAMQKVPPYWNPAAKPALRQALEDADVLYMRMGLTLLNDLARRFANQAGVPYVYNAEGCLCPTRLREKGFEKWWFLRLVERRVIRQAARLHACTIKEREDYLSQGARPEQIEVIPNGVALPESYSESGPTKAFRQKYAISSGPIVLYFSRLVEVKAPDVLLCAFASVCKETDAQLVYAGSDGGMEKGLRQLSNDLGVKQRVYFLGNLQGEDKTAALNAASMFALISRSEGLPNAALEALAYGLPCLLGTGCNLPEVAEYGAGLFVEPNFEQAKQGLRRMLGLEGQESPLAAMAVQARNLAEERFAISRIVDSIEQSFESIRSRRVLA